MSDWIALIIGCVALVVTFYLTIVARDYNKEIAEGKRNVEILKERMGGETRELRGLQTAIRTLGEAMEHHLLLTDNLIVCVDSALHTSDEDRRKHIAETLLKRTTESRSVIAQHLVLLDGVDVRDIDEFKQWVIRCLGLLDQRTVVDYAREILPLLSFEETLAASKYLDQISRRPRWMPSTSVVSA